MHVEAERRKLQGRGFVAGCRIAQLPVDQVVEGAVHHRDALGLAGRAGSVDGVGETRGRVPGGQARGFAGCGRVSVELEIHLGRRRLARQRQAFLLEHERGPRVVEHEGESLRRVARVERQVASASLEHGQQRNDCFQRTLEGDRHHAVWRYAARDQLPCQLIGVAVELCVTERTLTERDRERVAPAVDLSFEAFDERLPTHFRAVPRAKL